MSFKTALSVRFSTKSLLLYNKNIAERISYLAKVIVDDFHKIESTPMTSRNW